MDIKVQFGSLAEAQGNIASTSTKLGTQLGELKSDLAPLAASWTGAASDNYKRAQREWDEAAKALQEILAKVGVALGHANDNYQDGERKAADLW
ncbi:MULTISPECIES: WXG100 family type VII secretion target [Allokutzneria]|uniref:ESAT-6-like protein n=1 Tax=Allokutzneria multivorans TaxID=1142134 RepID=A0ABP7RQ03_9PSEU|nr:WXG100 family type VII secretion target [Allokutzneria sp. NRRL B-24872]